MGPTPERPISDPLLRYDRGERDALGRPVRAPFGNSIRTFAVLVVLVAVGVAIWWVRRPHDLDAVASGEGQEHDLIGDVVVLGRDNDVAGLERD